jgi:hypothetical protein
MFLAYQPLHILTKTLTLSWIGILACVSRMISSYACSSPLHMLLLMHVWLPYTCFFSYMCGCLTCVVFPACVSTLHMFLFLHVRLPYTCYFSYMCIYITHRSFPQNWACAQQAPNTNIVTRPESLPNSSVCHCFCQCVIHFGDSLGLCLSLVSPFDHIFHELRGDWVL